MSLKLVVAYVREQRVGALLERLRAFGVRGISVSQAQGMGEYINPHGNYGLEPHRRIDVMLEASKAQSAAELIMEVARSGLTGDGVVAIMPIENLFRIRDNTEIVGS